MTTTSADLPNLVSRWTALNVSIREAEQRRDESALEALVLEQASVVRAIAVIPATNAATLALKFYMLRQAEQGDAPDVPACGIVVPAEPQGKSEEEALRYGLLMDVLRIPAFEKLARGDSSELLAALGGAR